MTAPVRAILIARSSKDRHDVSCNSQIEEMRRAARGKQEFIVKELVFPGTRHSDFLEDPDFKDLLEEAKRKDRAWNKVWFYDTSRLSRNRLKAQTTKAFFRRHGIAIEFLKVPSTGEEPLDNVIEGILETFDQLHSDFSRAGSIRGQRQNVRMGYRAGGRAPFGYRLKRHVLGRSPSKEEISKTTLEPDDETFAIVREYLKRRATGETRASIYRDFEQRGIRSPSGGSRWNPSTGVYIERNLFVYLGHLVYNRHSRRVDGTYPAGSKYRAREEWEVHEDCHKAAITPTQARAIDRQNQRNAVRSARSSTPTARSYLLTGLLRCGSCGGPMVGDRGFYICSWSRRHQSSCKNNGISAERLDQYVLRQTKDTLLSRAHFETVVAATRKAYEKEVQTTSRRGRQSNVRVSALSTQIERLLDLYAKGVGDSATVERKIGELTEERERLTREAAASREVSAVLQYAADQISDEAIRGYCDRFEKLLSDSNRGLMRQFLDQFVARVEVFPRQGSRKSLRQVDVHGVIPQFTRIALVSPTGFEPVLPP